MEKNNAKQYLQKEIILFPCPYSDFSKTKIRPGIIISNNNYNKKQEDLLIAPITTQYKDNYSIRITNEDIISGKIVNDSEIRADKILSIHKSLIISQIALTNDKILILLIQKLLNLLKSQ